MNSDGCNASVTRRREFLAQLSRAVTGSALALGTASWAQECPAAATDTAGPLPTIRLGDHRVTRLIAGSNPINGYSYLGPLMDRHMRDYFTPERIVEFLTNCERAGIDTHQFGGPGPMAAIIRTLRERGSKMKFLCLHSSEPDNAPVEQVVREHDLIALVHHGGATDRLFQQGKSQQVHDFVKRVHDAGILAGVSAHNPACIQRIADEGWEVDLFMTCFYHLTRTPEDLAKMPEVATLEVSYPFFASDPQAMTNVVRQVRQPCLGFKILAAGRSCHDPQSVRQAFQFAYEHIKPIDGVIVGMYPRYHDQVSENAALARQLAAPPHT